MERTTTAGIYKRHAQRCAKTGKAAGTKVKCTCGTSTYLAKVPTGASGRTISRTFHNYDEAKRWRREQMREIDAGADYSTQETVGQALDALTADLSREASIAKGRRPFKASTAKGYLSNVQKLREALGGALASTQLRDLTPSLVQEVVDELVETVALTPKGFATFQTGVPFYQPAELTETHQLFAKMFKHHGAYVSVVPTYIGGYMALTWFGRGGALGTNSADLVAARFKAAQIATDYYDAAVHGAAFQLPPWIRRLLG